MSSEFLQSLKQHVEPKLLDEKISNDITDKAHMDQREYYNGIHSEHGDPIFEFTGRLKPHVDLATLVSFLTTHPLASAKAGHPASIYHADRHVSLVLQVPEARQEEFTQLVHEWHGKRRTGRG